MRRAAMLLALAGGSTLLTASCVSPPGNTLAALLQKVVSRDRPERVDAFQRLLQVRPDLAPLLKPLAPIGAEHGHPVVAVLYRIGEGDAVPLDVLARHFARFEWPPEHEMENVLMEATILREMKHDLARAGRPAVRHLGAALRGSPRAGLVAALMVGIDERAAAEAFADQLDVPAARDALRRIAGTDDVAEWWAQHRGADADAWIRFRCRRSLEEDVAAFERETGHRFASLEEAAAWWRENEHRSPVEWWSEAFPDASPANFAPLYRAVEGGAPAAHRLLQRWTGLRLAHAAPDLATRWRRLVESPILRLRFAVLGPADGGEPWTQERMFPAVETLQAGGGRLMASFMYDIFLHIGEEGTSLLLGEYASDNDGTRGGAREHRLRDRIVLYSDILHSYIAITVEELSSRLPPEAPEATRRAVLAALRSALPEPDAALALGYAADRAALPQLRDALAKDPTNPALARALLLLDDPAGLMPGLTVPHAEREILRGRCRDPRIQEFLRSP